jgi:signal transduction histidine kinase
MTSLRHRLTIASIVWIAVGVVLLDVLIAAVYRSHVTRQFDDEIASHLDELQRLVEFSPDGKVSLRGALSDPNYDVPLSGYYWEIQRERTVLARSSSLQGPALRVSLEEPPNLGRHMHLIEGPTGTLRAMDRLLWPDAAKPPFHFVIGADQRHLERIVTGFHTTLVWSLTGFALAMIASAATLIFVALRPLAALRRRLGDVRTGGQKQVQGQFPAEVQPLVDDLNTMISASSNLVARARAQAGNLAHGMKTSLAVLTDEAHRLEEQGFTKSSKVILGHCRRMQVQIDHQMARARAAALRAAPGVSASPAKVAMEVVSALGRLYGHRGLRIEQTIPMDMDVACDAQDLSEMLANLVDNACKHARSTVCVSLADRVPPAPEAEILIEDDGPGLPPEAWEVVTKMGERWDSREQGSGLGLAIVKELATLYGGSVALDRSELGGLKACLRLPKVR